MAPAITCAETRPAGAIVLPKCRQVDGGDRPTQLPACRTSSDHGIRPPELGRHGECHRGLTRTSTRGSQLRANTNYELTAFSLALFVACMALYRFDQNL